MRAPHKVCGMMRDSSTRFLPPLATAAPEYLTFPENQSNK